MHILYVSQYFPPEIGAPAARVFELSREWVKAGHRVTVLTGFPNHPSGQIPAEYRRKWLRGTVREQEHGINVVRTWLYPSANRGTVGRIVNYFSFSVSAAMRGMALVAPDIVIGSSPQPLVAASAYVLARRFRCPFVFEVRDLWPESLPAVGQSTTRSLLYRAVSVLATFLYRRADLVVPVSSRFLPFIHARAPLVNAKVVENGVDGDLFFPRGDRTQLKEQLGLAGKFVVTYAGTIGMAHGLGLVLTVAQEIKDKLPNVMFLMVGDGAEYPQLQEKAARMGIENVLFVGPKPRARIPEYVGASDLCLVLLRRAELFETVLPTKMLEFMACGRPVVLGVGGLAKSMIEESDAGICIPPEDGRALLTALQNLHADDERRARLGANGRRYIEQKFTRAQKADEYIQVLRQMGMKPE